MCCLTALIASRVEWPEYILLPHHGDPMYHGGCYFYFLHFNASKMLQKYEPMQISATFITYIRQNIEMVLYSFILIELCPSLTLLFQGLNTPS